MTSFQKTVYSYYRTHGRHSLPWRATTNPYHILVSEVMLQQTQVPRVIGKYHAFLAAFPDLGSLSKAPLKELLKQWQGLGYNRRALSLKKLAEEVTTRFDSRIPEDRDTLKTLPGIGEATSGSLAAFAFNQPVVFIETNIRSVFLHHFFKDKEGVADDQLMPLIARHLDKRHPREWYWALMDYGVYLKQQFPNPSRRSSHHHAQSRFEGSDRQVRGRILKALVASNAAIGEKELFRAAQVPAARGKKALAGMVKEGLARYAGRKVTV